MRSTALGSSVWTNWERKAKKTSGNGRRDGVEHSRPWRHHDHQGRHQERNAHDGPSGSVVVSIRER